MFRWVIHIPPYSHFIYVLKYVPLHGSCAFAILVTKPIEEGEELFADYGPGWFEEGECPCSSCISNSTTK
jgi:hypothetical protein